MDTENQNKFLAVDELLVAMKDDVSKIQADIEVIKVKLEMLQRVVYGAVSVILLAVLTAGLKFILAQ